MFYKIFIKLLSSAEINSTMLNNDVKFTKKKTMTLLLNTVQYKH